MTKMDPNKMMAELGKMQQQMEQAQEQLKTEYVEHSAGGGAVTVKMSGSLEVRSASISRAPVRGGAAAESRRPSSPASRSPAPGRSAKRTT